MRSRLVFLRFVGRYVIATVMIPVGVALGVCGLVQHALRRAPAKPDSEDQGPAATA